ncbi:helix-turn-helix domain-containing protein [Xanthobacter aminoxidans]|uniref:Cupin domain-containing protein n=1 Tax=Xanthobacter aminoxidans TaxID=186280 RepID=A0ABW6ZD42_9HYPH
MAMKAKAPARASAQAGSTEKVPALPMAGEATKSVTKAKSPGRARSAEAALGPSEQSAARVPLEKRIGNVLRNRRASANLTLAEVSAGAGISSAMLSRIENGAAAASLDSLERVCEALGIGMAELFQETDQQNGMAQLIKRADQMEVVRVGTKHGHTYRLLSYDRGPRKIFEPFFIEMDKKSLSWPRFSHPGTEFIYMLQGRMEYRFGERTYILEPGDAFTFSGNVVHGPERLLDERAKFLSIIIYNE